MRLCLLRAWLVSGLLSVLLAATVPAGESGSPNTAAAANANAACNILFAIADDWGPHAGAYGTPWVHTPAFDRVAAEGVLFRHAFTPMAKCAPSRAIVLTGRSFWQLEQAASHMSYFPAKFTVWPEVLTRASWHMGFTGKGWGPGIAVDAAGKPRLMTGKAWQKHKLQPPTQHVAANDYAANFRDFLDAAPAGAPWCFWYGCLEPHRDYEYGSGVRQSGRRPAEIDRVPEFWPDDETVRTDMLDYALEVEHADRQLGLMLQELEARGLLETTLVIVTSDHGMPFPRAKGYAYDASCRVPLAIRCPNVPAEQRGRTVDDFVSFPDLAPTILDYAGIATADSGMAEMYGQSLRPILESSNSGQIQPERTRVIVGKERTDVGRPGDVGYPIRGLRTSRYLYLCNYEPSRWPAGNPETGYPDTDGSPTKSLILQRGRVDRSDRSWQLNFGMRPAEELYDLQADPDCVRNLAMLQQSVAAELRLQLEAELQRSGDPRMTGNGSVFDGYPVTSGSGFHEAVRAGRRPPAGWINPTDFEQEPVQP
ncbi:heparan N-sulfatase [Planctomyces bekefii]|uniref:Heparan N-sulfatase n=1 Tax=Planctomyces bekefii TaxID=1653850 RepID=A0A5C6MCY7_9PLAN|nr:heparan N-sulfatase [Planctomyces bekefii]